MRFRLLLEAVDSSVIDAMYNSENKEERIKAILEYVESKGMKDLLDILKRGDDSSSTMFSAIMSSLDSGKESASKFEMILSGLNLKAIKPDNYRNFLRLAKLISDQNGIIVDRSKRHLFLPSLYNRNTTDFDYALRAFDIVTDASKKAKTFRDPKRIDEKELYKSQNEIKPSGRMTNDKSTDTIFGTMYAWNRDLGVVDPKEKKSTGPIKKSKGESDFRTFSSFEEADKKMAKEEVKIIHIDGDFKFDDSSKKWVPYKE